MNNFNLERYDDYVNQYINFSKNNNNIAIVSTDLRLYGLPPSKWFIENCPDNTVTSWSEFVRWCGLYVRTNGKYDECFKQIIENKLHEYEKKLGRPIKSTDIKDAEIGFSLRVICHFWGTIDNCRRTIGLQDVVHKKKTNFKDYMLLTEQIIEEVKPFLCDNKISYAEIIKYKTKPWSRECFVRHCSEANINPIDFFSKFGLVLVNRAGIGQRSTDATGENYCSVFEKYVSSYINELGFKYLIDYDRDVLYRDIVDNNSIRKIDCDYVFKDGRCIEVAGLAHNKTGNWYDENYNKDVRNRNYVITLKEKFDILKQSNVNFLFLFIEDFYKSELYKQKIHDFLIGNYQQ